MKTRKQEKLFWGSVAAGALIAGMTTGVGIQDAKALAMTVGLFRFSTIS